MVSVAKNGLVGGVFWSVARSWGTRVATLLVFFILTRLLAPEEIGLISYILGWLMLLAVFADLGLAEYIVYNHDSPRLTELGIWWFQVVVSFCIALILIGLLLAGWINPDKSNNDAVWAMIVLSLTMPHSERLKVIQKIFVGCVQLCDVVQGNPMKSWSGCTW